MQSGHVIGGKCCADSGARYRKSQADVSTVSGGEDMIEWLADRAFLKSNGSLWCGSR